MKNGDVEGMPGICLLQNNLCCKNSTSQGVDFGKFTTARVEKIRWHPLYDFVEALKSGRVTFLLRVFSLFDHLGPHETS